MTTNIRNKWGDSVKGVGILLVLYGHMPYIGDRLADWIYAFHMPLFVVISGYFWKVRIDCRVRDIVRKEWRALMIPYVLFWTATWLFWLLKSVAMGRSILWWKPFVGLVYGVDGLDHWMENNAVLWFFPFLFSLRVSFGLLWRVPQKRRLLIAGFAFLAAGIWIGMDHWRLPWSLDYALYAWPLFALGVWWKQQGSKFAPTWKTMLLAIFLLLSLGYVSAQDWMDRMVWNGGRLLPWWSMWFASFTGVLAVMLLRFPKHIEALLAYVGQRSLWLFALHLPAYSVFAAIWTILMGRGPTSEDPAYLLFQFAMPLLALGCILVVHPKLKST